MTAAEAGQGRVGLLLKAVVLWLAMASSEVTAGTLDAQVAPSPATSWHEETMRLPLYGPTELRLTPERLVPSRVIKASRGPSLDSIFREDVQVIVSLERSIATRWVDDAPTLDHEGFRVRWRANTHNQIDEAWIDLETLGLRRTVAGYRSLTWYHDDRVVNVTIPPDSVPAQRVFETTLRPYYSNVTLPYVFAAMNVEPGTSFRLEAFSVETGQPVPIRIDVVGMATYADAAGQALEVLQVESRSPTSQITWFIDPRRAPHYLGSTWRTLTPDGSVSTITEEHVVDWVSYDRDVYGDRTHRR